MTKKTMMPTSEKLIKTPPGPASLNAFPDPTSKPGPIIPTPNQHTRSYTEAITTNLQ
jgi:hypothetical protein